jgi:hypothetical protein
VGTKNSRTFLGSFVLAAVIVVAIGCGGSSSPQVTPQPTPTPNPNPTPTPTPTLASVTLASSSVAGGNNVQGTITLTSAAPAAGVVVNLTSSQANAVVPATVTVASGATTATFSITTTAVTADSNATITASLSGVTRTATLAVTTAPLVAVMAVVSASRGNNACALSNGGNTIDCTFNGTNSQGAVRTWKWDYVVGSKSGSNTSSEAITRPEPGCDFFRGHNPTTAGGVQFLQMVVTLTVSDARGISSQPVTNGNVRVFPNMTCGYAF